LAITGSANRAVVDGRLLGFVTSADVKPKTLTNKQSKRVTVCSISLENDFGMNESVLQGALLSSVGRLIQCQKSLMPHTYSKAHISYKTQPKLNMSALASYGALEETSWCVFRELTRETSRLTLTGATYPGVYTCSASYSGSHFNLVVTHSNQRMSFRLSWMEYFAKPKVSQFYSPSRCQKYC
jgi:hypothetical protein